MENFFNEVRENFGKLNQKQVACLSSLYTATVDLSIEYRAYIMATAWHETGRFKYTKEIWGPTVQQKKYDVPHKIAKQLGNIIPGDGKRYMGRGFVQITGRRNYEWASRVIGQDLIAKPELAESIENATKLIIAGVMTGAFTGKKLSNYSNYVDMRRTVNGVDKADLIAEYAVKFEEALKA